MIAPAIIAAGIGLAGSLLKKGPGPQISGLDPKSQAYVDFMRKNAQGYFSGNVYGGPNENVLNAISLWNRATQAGDLGQRALTGDTAALSQIMGPGSELLGSTFAGMRANAATAANQAATRAGAFGGSRSAIAQALSSRETDKLESQTRYQQIQDALQRAFGMFGAGQQAGSNLFGAGQYLQSLPMEFQRQQLGLLNMGMGPTGTQGPAPQGRDIWGTLMGAGLAGLGSMGGGSKTATNPMFNY